MKWSIPAIAIAHALAGSSGIGSAEDQQGLQCEAYGSAILVPPISDAAACARFSSSIEAAMTHRPSGNAVLRDMDVTLQFTAYGVARAGVESSTQRFESFNSALAITDKPLGPAAIDQLAAEVALKLLKE